MLNKTKLKTDIKAALLDQRTKTDNPQAAADQLASKIADAVDSYVRGIQITYTVGLSNSSGPVVGAFNYTIS